jgi:hypothetical protein
MKIKLVVLFVLAFFARLACAQETSPAQDSVSISYAEETDTVPRQYFIDRYENVFMTKVPTRQMLKLGYIGSDFRGTGFQLGYEYKLSRSLSIELAVYAQRSFGNGMSLALPVAFNFWGHAKARWYLNMNKRISGGLSANNFSGRYIGFSYDRSFSFAKRMVSYQETMNRVGLLWGFQSRFFSSGHVDFAVGLFNRQIWNDFPREYSRHFIHPKDFALATQPLIGIAIGDWKRTRATANCEILLCDEQIDHHWKLGLPDITIGLKNRRAALEVYYEKKIKKSAFSIQPGIKVNYFYRYYSEDISQSSYNANLAMALRYYFLQNLQMKKGRTGNSLSGPYASFSLDYLFVRSVFKAFTPTQTGYIGSATLSMGYQQRLFRKIYVDGSIYYARRLLSKYPADTGGELALKLGLGFTF